MSKAAKLDPGILESILATQNFEEASPSQQLDLLKQVEHLSLEEAFDLYLNWNGLIGYTSQILTAIRSMEKAGFK